MSGNAQLKDRTARDAVAKVADCEYGWPVVSEALRGGLWGMSRTRLAP